MKTAKKILQEIFNLPETQDWYKPVLQAMEEYASQSVPKLDGWEKEMFKTPTPVTDGGLGRIMLKFGEAHDLLAKTKLSSEEYQPISGLLATAKVELFNYYQQQKLNTPVTDKPFNEGDFKKFFYEKFKHYSQYYDNNELLKEHFKSGEVTITVTDMFKIISEYLRIGT